MTWIQTYSGHKFDYAQPTPEMIYLDDIEKGLESMPRFAGHLRSPYTVACHSVNLCQIVWEYGYEARLAALFHDAAEAYTMDIPAPLKRMLGEPFVGIEINIERAVSERFGIKYPWPEVIKEQDLLLCYAEAHKFGNNPPIDGWAGDPENIKVDLEHVEIRRNGMWAATVKEVLSSKYDDIRG